MTDGQAQHAAIEAHGGVNIVHDLGDRRQVPNQGIVLLRCALSYYLVRP